MNLYNTWFHFLKWVTKNIDIFHDILIYWNGPVYLNPGRPEWVTEVNRSVEVSTGMNKRKRAGRRDRNLILLWNSSDDSKPALSLFPSQPLPIPLSLSQTFSIQPCFSLVTFSPLSLSLCPRSAHFSSLVSSFLATFPTSLSLSLSTDGPECKTLSVECIWGYQQSGEELISLLLCRVIPSPESQRFAPLFQLTSKQHQGHAQYHFV